MRRGGKGRDRSQRRYSVLHSGNGSLSSSSVPSPPSSASAPSYCVSGASSNGVDWELRPGGMLVQRRHGSAQPSPSFGPLLKLKVTNGSRQHDVSIPSEATFGELKWTLAPLTGLHPQEQRLLFRGKERDDTDYLHLAGVDDKAKIILVEDPASKAKKKEGLSKDESVVRACQTVAHVREEADKLAGEIMSLKAIIGSGNKVSLNKFSSLSELLMRQLLKLDSIVAEGQAKTQRKIEVERIQGFADMVERLKAENSKFFHSNSVVVTTQWETFDNGTGSLLAPQPVAPSPTIATNRALLH